MFVAATSQYLAGLFCPRTGATRTRHAAPHNQTKLLLLENNNPMLKRKKERKKHTQR
jgi:hypothetical protein